VTAVISLPFLPRYQIAVCINQWCGIKITIDWLHLGWQVSHHWSHGLIWNSDFETMP